jgi:hypothetical protein
MVAATCLEPHQRWVRAEGAAAPSGPPPPSRARDCMRKLRAVFTDDTPHLLWMREDINNVRAAIDDLRNDDVCLEILHGQMDARLEHIQRAATASQLEGVGAQSDGHGPQ